MSVYSVDIPAGATGLSGAVEFRKTKDAQNGEGLIRIDMPGTWTAAALTFQVSDDNVTFRNLYAKDGTEYSVTVAASRAVIMKPADFAGIRFIKIRSGTSGTPVDQTTTRTLELVTRPL